MLHIVTYHCTAVQCTCMRKTRIQPSHGNTMHGKNHYSYNHTTGSPTLNLRSYNILYTYYIYIYIYIIYLYWIYYIYIYICAGGARSSVARPENITGRLSHVAYRLFKCMYMYIYVYIDELQLPRWCYSPRIGSRYTPQMNFHDEYGWMDAWSVDNVYKCTCTLK
jgi:hypothetical protein